jgi:alginate O-acetyltransferase complex protein AlgI
VSFTSYPFLFLFLPVFLGMYVLIPARWRAGLLLIASLGFYAAWDWRFLILLQSVTIVSYATAHWITTSSNQRESFLRLSFGVGFNLITLAIFKYANFGLEALNTLVRTLGLPAIPMLEVILPVGLSFYVFAAIAYLVDVHRKDTPASNDPIRFAAFMGSFVHILNGPILRSSVLEQFAAPQVNLESFARGATRFMAGLSKKILLADPLGPLVQTVFATPQPSAADVWLGAFAYTMQLFFDFAGYSDMAIGLAGMLGFSYPENFNHPYTARSITEFWQRWHLSLSRFLRQYLYIPLGGNRHGTTRTYINLFLTMALGGLWHGANWTFVIWGAWNGGFLMLERFLANRFKLPVPPVWYALPKTMAIVILGRLFFVAPSVSRALEMFAGAFGFHGFQLSANVALDATPERLLTLLAGTLLVYLAPWWAKLEPNLNPIQLRVYHGAQLALAPMFVFAVMTLAAQDYTPFLYFRF